VVLRSPFGDLACELGHLEFAGGTHFEHGVDYFALTGFESVAHAGQTADVGLVAEQNQLFVHELTVVDVAMGGVDECVVLVQVGQPHFPLVRLLAVERQLNVGVHGLP